MSRKFPGLMTEDGDILVLTTEENVDIETDGSRFFFIPSGGGARDWCRLRGCVAIVENCDCRVPVVIGVLVAITVFAPILIGLYGEY